MKIKYLLNASNTQDSIREKTILAAKMLINKYGFRFFSVDQVSKLAGLKCAEVLAVYDSIEEIQVATLRLSFLNLFSFFSHNYTNSDIDRMELETVWHGLIGFSGIHTQEVSLLLRYFDEPFSQGNFNLKKELSKGLPSLFNGKYCASMPSYYKCILLFRFQLRGAVLIRQRSCFQQDCPGLLAEVDRFYQQEIMDEIDRLRILPFI